MQPTQRSLLDAIHEQPRLPLDRASELPGTYPDPKALARRHDPVTSRLGAESIEADLPRLHRETLAAVRANPGLTQLELDTNYRHSTRVFGRRLNEVAKRGLIRRGEKRKCRVSGRLAETWWPVE